MFDTLTIVCALVQPGKCLYTTVRELVENSLDAAEDAGRLPEIDITMCARLSFALGDPRRVLLLASSIYLINLSALRK